MRSTAKRSVSLLFSLFFIFVAIAFYIFFVRPSYTSILELRGTIASKDNFYTEQSQAIKKVKDLITKYKGSTKFQETLSLSFPIKENLSLVFSQLKALASINGLNVGSFTVKPLAFKPLAKNKLVKEAGVLELGIKLSGSYASFKDFLAGLENNIRLMDVQSFTIERATANPNTDFFNFNLTVQTYYQPEN